MGFCATLTIVFIILKLIGVISWGWFAVCSPLIAEAIIDIIVILITGGILIKMNKD